MYFSSNILRLDIERKQVKEIEKQVLKYFNWDDKWVVKWTTHFPH